jgi:hypothetical protein
MKPRDLPLIFLTFSLLVVSASGQQEIAIPGSPNGDLKTELLQSRTYCRSMDRQLAKIKDKFPALNIERFSAEASWKSSPFAIGCDAIESDILKAGGEKGKAFLKKLDQQVWEMTDQHIKIESAAEAQAFLTLVDQRAKGAIEVPMVRGNLLWNYKPFQENPEKEVERGYIQKITHTTNIGKKITFEVPMSWKPEKSPKTDLMGFRNCYGHGNIWMTVFVSPTTNANGQTITAQERFEIYSEDSLRAEYKTLGIELTSFLKTKVNGMAALLFTRDQPYEQLGQRATRSAEVIRVFSGNHMISFQINALGPEGDTVAVDLIKKNHKLFMLLGGSLRLMD